VIQQLSPDPKSGKIGSHSRWRRSWCVSRRKSELGQWYLAWVIPRKIVLEPERQRHIILTQQRRLTGAAVLDSSGSSSLEVFELAKVAATQIAQFSMLRTSHQLSSISRTHLFSSPPSRRVVLTLDSDLGTPGF